MQLFHKIILRPQFLRELYLNIFLSIRVIKLTICQKGYSGLCLLNFPQGKPDILKNIPVYGENKDYEKHDILILTQRAVLERIFDEYNDFSQY